MSNILTQITIITIFGMAAFAFVLCMIVAEGQSRNPTPFRIGGWFVTLIFVYVANDMFPWQAIKFAGQAPVYLVALSAVLGYPIWSRMARSLSERDAAAIITHKVLSARDGVHAFMDKIAESVPAKAVKKDQRNKVTPAMRKAAEEEFASMSSVFGGGR